MERAGPNTGKTTNTLVRIDFCDDATNIEWILAKNGKRSAGGSLRAGNRLFNKARIVRHTAEKDPFVHKIHGAHLEIRFQEKSLTGERKIEQLGRFGRLGRRYDRHAQGDEIRLEGKGPIAQAGVGHLDHQVAIGSTDLRGSLIGVTHKEDPSTARFSVVALAKTVGDDVLVEHGDLAIRVEHLDADRVLHRAGATGPGAVKITDLVRLDTLDHHQMIEVGHFVRLVGNPALPALAG